MAITTISPQIIDRNSITTFDELTFTSVDKSTGVAVPMQDDARLLIICQNSGSVDADIMIVKGDALQSSNANLSKTVGNGKMAILTVESGLFGNVTGELRGNLYIKSGSSDIKIAATVLPE